MGPGHRDDDASPRRFELLTWVAMPPAKTTLRLSLMPFPTCIHIKVSNKTCASSLVNLFLLGYKWWVTGEYCPC